MITTTRDGHQVKVGDVVTYHGSLTEHVGQRLQVDDLGCCPRCEDIDNRVTPDAPMRLVLFTLDGSREFKHVRVTSVSLATD